MTESKAEILAAFAAVYVLWGSTYLAIRFGVETLPPRVSTYAYVNPIVAVLLGTLFAGEVLTLRIGLAAAAIVAAVALIIRHGGEDAKTVEKEELAA